jgi:hypothetical protein
VVPLAACYEDALTEAVEGGEAVGSSLDHLDLVDHSLGVAVADRLVEVGEQFVAPEPDQAVKDGIAALSTAARKRASRSSASLRLVER